MAVALGHGFAAVLTEGGGLWVFGKHEYGELGLGAPTGAATPARPRPALLGGVGTPVTGCEGGGPGADSHPFHNEPLVMVAAGRQHAAAVTDQGAVWLWGLNHQQQLGAVPRLGDGYSYRPTPQRWPATVCGGVPVVMMACGDEHTLALTRAGHVWSCGQGLSGQGGTPDRGRTVEPVQVPGVERITLVAAGRKHSLAVAQDGRLWSWGDPVLLPKANTAWTPADWDRPAHTPRALEASVFGGSAVLSVTVGWAHSAAVTATGELWTWGVGTSGCKGIGTMTFAQSQSRVPRRVGTEQTVQAGAEGAEAGSTGGVGGAVAGAFAGASVYMAACGGDHTVVLTDSGVVWTCGSGTLGALGHETEATCMVPTRIPLDCFGGHAVVSVAAARNVSMAVTAAGVLYSWGSGAVGHGDPDPYACVMRPTVVAATLPRGSRVARTCEIPPDSSVAFCMGSHARLGGDLCAYRSLPHELLARIVESGRGLRGAFLHMGEGLLRMLAVRRRVA